MRRLLGVLLAVAAAATALAGTAATGAAAAECTSKAESYADPNTGQSWNSVTYCGDDANTPLYVGANSSTPAGTLLSTTSWFVCYRHGEQHAGGNDVWYYTQGDRSAEGQEFRRAWGYTP